MKRISTLLFVTLGIVAAEPQYSARGWKPQGAQLMLPQPQKRIEPRISFYKPHIPHFLRKLHSKPIVFPKLYRPQEVPRFRLSPAYLQNLGQPHSYNTLPAEMYAEPPKIIQQPEFQQHPPQFQQAQFQQPQFQKQLDDYQYSTITQNMLQNYKFGDGSNNFQRFREPSPPPNYQNNHHHHHNHNIHPERRPQMNFRAPFMQQQQQQQLRGSMNPINFPRNPQPLQMFSGSPRMPQQQQMNNNFMMQRVVAPKAPLMFLGPQDQILTAEEQKQLYPTGPQLPLSEDPSGFDRMPVTMSNAFPRPNPKLPRLEGPVDFRRNPMDANSVQPSTDMRDLAPENQLLPKMQAPQNFHGWTPMPPKTRPDLSVSDLRPPAQQFLPDQQRSQAFTLREEIGVAGNNAGIELKDEGYDTYRPPSPPKEKPTERPQMLTTTARSETITPKPTKKITKKPEATTPKPSSDEYDDDDYADNDDDEERNIAVSTAVANGHYYLLLPDGKLQKVTYKATDVGGDGKKGPIKADLTYQNVEPITGPIYKFDGSALVRLN